jgi:hypothetical protein
MANKGSFIKNNLGGLIFSIVLVVFADVVMASAMEYGAGKYIALSILHIPVVFIAWVIGNAIRKAIHPDFVVASGFWGLLKERIFWRIGPQVILALIVFSIAVNVTGASVNKKDVSADRKANPSSIAEAKGNDTDVAVPEFLELSKVEFIRMVAGDNPFVETDVSKLATMIKRGNKYLKVTGTMTNEFGWDINAASSLPEPVAVLDLSSVQGGGYNINSMSNSSGISNFQNIEVVILGDAFTTIPNMLFRLCRTLKAVYLPDSITSIGSMAFQSSGITEIVIPPSVTEIGGEAFQDCHNLRYVYFSKNSGLTNIGNYTFDGCESLYSVSIPASLKTIGKSAFKGGDYHPAGLENITVPIDSQLETVGDEAFAYTNMTTFTFPKTIKEIGRVFGEDAEEQVVSVVIKAITPPKVTSYTFPKTIQSIYVPAESLKAYEDAWFDYEFTFNNQLKALP